MANVDDELTRLAQGLVDGADRGEPLPLRMCKSAVRVSSAHQEIESR